MNDIPFSTFQGFLKRIDIGARSEIERQLFAQLFPQFYSRREISQAARERNEKMIDPFQPLLQIEEDLVQPRRFAGVSLPRGRYNAVCKDASGDDGGTLVNELRAYRNPATTGRVDVIDLGRAPDKAFGPARTALAVILYEIDKVPSARRLLRNRVRGSSNPQEVLVVEYPYEVLQVHIQRTVDLRLPDVRDWFFRQFSKEQEDGSIVWMPGKAVARQMPQEIRDELERDSVTILSRFQRRAGIAPPPADFFGMLPTLMNPELGGGTAADGGAILQAIGTWMCRNEVGALIYPSARCDAFVEFKSQDILDFGGWNLVDYRGAVDAERCKYSYIVQSPWAWTTFPGDVRVEVKDATLTEAGSFGVVGMESYWRRDYGYWIKSLDVVDKEASLVGKNVLLGSGQQATRAAA